MSWNDGTMVFDAMCEVILNEELEGKKEVIKKLAEVLEGMGWDCHDESDYWKHPIVVEAIEELHPTWFDEEGL